MAEIVPDEGLDFIIGVLLRNTPAPPANLYLGVFTSQTDSTVPAAGAVLATQSGITEAAYAGYARAAVSAAAWGAVGAKTMWGQSGRGSTASQTALPAASGSSATPVNGFFLATALTGGVALLYSNFDAGAIVAIASGDVIRVTPTWGLLG